MSAALSAVPSGYLAGSWREPASGRTFTVTDPATGAALAQVADCGIDDGLAALDAAVAAGPSWARSAPRRRADVLRRAFELMRERREVLATLITLEVGKTLTEARGEVDYAADFVRWFAEEAVRPGGRSTPAPDGQSHFITVTEPVGPCLLITPWNVPLAMVARKVSPAIAAGCTVVVKPADLTPLVTLAFAAIVREAGAPAGVVNVFTTTDAAGVCSRLIEDPRLRKLSFTGSTPVGRLLLEQAGRRVLRTSMELGGNAPFLVFDDADLDVTIDQAMIAKMRLGGQSCVAANRFLVQDGIADDFARRIGERMAAVRVGPGLDDGVDLGPLIDDRAVAKATRLVDDAVARGAVVIDQAPMPDDPQGTYFAPIVLDHVPLDAAIMSEEVFGPVVSIHRFTDEDAAVRIANDTEHGLAAYVMTQDVDRARRVAGSLESGMVGINRGLISNVAAPFGGIKQSGLGREGGPEGLLEYQELKYLSVPGLYA
ncbi:NAD-dependent succinate-semialdehyde dehydrogenase [Occultella glacieicola]|uniref:NAD-dependent succinate-semialdehyde dehydrogenase n=2 Tax=Occultella glacieicola TaxID=2518684 RepID=A0ABY2DX95_9MICO|nr:NAD-dependent succinate-semialdehyde dehydrogenase [Occultella glacieicola]